MTVTDAIRLADLTRPNELDRELKLRWLSGLDGRLNAEVLAPHGNAVELSPYTQQTPPKTDAEDRAPGPLALRRHLRAVSGHDDRL